jgi:hypothetical protein
MASRSNAVLSALATAVKRNPRLSAGLAFELGMMVGAFVKSSRGRKGIAGATARLIDAAPLISSSPPSRRTAKRGPAPRRRKASRRAA